MNSRNKDLGFSPAGAEFSILELEVNPRSDLLYAREISVVLEVIRRTLENLAVPDVGGACILDGQPRDGEAECILRAVVRNEGMEVAFQKKNGKTCVEMAEMAIDAILGWPEEAMRCFGYSNGIATEDGAFGMNGIYRNGPLNVLVLNATHGRFLFGCCLVGRRDDDIINSTVMHAVAEALAKLGVEDTVLQESVGVVQSQINLGARKTTSLNTKAIGHVRKMFSMYPTPVMRKWREWREDANGSGELKLFFQK